MTKDAASQACGISLKEWREDSGISSVGRLAPITTARKPAGFWLERNEMKRPAPALDVCSGQSAFVTAPITARRSVDR
jgi:hypothetical protein